MKLKDKKSNKEKKKPHKHKKDCPGSCYGKKEKK